MTDPDARVWHVVIWNHPTPHIQKNLTALEAIHFLRNCGSFPNPWTNAGIKLMLEREFGSYATHAELLMNQLASISVGGWVINQHDVNQRTSTEYWGPDGETLDVWPKPDDYAERYARARKAYELVAKTNAVINDRRSA